jgi:PAS domain S-box-containing protein
MFEFLQAFFGPGSFIPHGHCYLWQTQLVGLHILSDGLIAASYFSIPIFLIALAQKRQDLPFRWLFWLFGGFIISCGTTHSMEVITLWYPVYWLLGVVKAITALLSVWTALELVPLLPQALTIPSTEQLKAINTQLEEIEERKVVEEALMESQRRYASLAEAVPVGIFRLDPSGNCIYINDYGCQMAGKPAAFMMGADWVQIIHPEDQERALKNWSDWMNSPEREQFYKIEARIQQPNGTIIWYYCQVMAEVALDGSLAGFVGSVTDITERKQIEQDLRKSEASLKEAQEVAHIGNWEYDLATGKITWSDEIFRIFGLTPEQPEPSYEDYLEQRFPPEYRERQHRCVMRALEEGEPYELDLQIIRADGSTGWILGRGKPILNADHQVVRLFGIAVDITERKAVEAQQQRLNELKDEFISTVSHELRSPLTSIKMASQLLEINIEKMLLALEALEASELRTEIQPPKIRQYLEILKRQSDQELELVNDLLNLQRLEADSFPVELTPIAVTEWLSQISSAFHDRAQERQQHLDVQLSPVPILHSDIEVLTSVLRELLTNACKYTPPGETITVGVHVQERDLQVRVSNTGASIPTQELSCIFDKFYRIPGGDPWKQGGTGLGLALAKKQIEYLGGSLWAESDAREIHFVISLPLTDRIDKITPETN